MNRADLAEYISQDLEISKSQADKLIGSFAGAVCEAIRKDRVKIVGFGTFSAVKRKARVGRNPQTGEEVKIPSRWAATFKPGSILRDAAERNKKK